jgi:c(7)-type cytochrome triheme protein
MALAAMHSKKKIEWAFLTVFISWTANTVERDGGFVVYPGGIGKMGAVVFRHRSHGAEGARYQCHSCHSSAPGEVPAVTMDRIRAGAACGACHDVGAKSTPEQKKASAISDCSSCHMPAADVIIELGRMDAVPFSHTRHLGTEIKNKYSKPVDFSCIDCHPVPFELGVKNPPHMELPHRQGGCAECHNGKKSQAGMPAAFAATTRCLCLTCHKL